MIEKTLQMNGYSKKILGAASQVKMKHREDQEPPIDKVILLYVREPRTGTREFFIDPINK